MKRSTLLKGSDNDKNWNNKNMVPNWGCAYNEMVKIGSSFCLSKLEYNHLVWTASFSFKLKK